MVRVSGKRGMAARRRHYEKVKNITDEQALENFKEKQRRLAEKFGWNDKWHKQKPINHSNKSRVKHTGHGGG